MLSPVAGDSTGALDPVAGLPAQPCANTEATQRHLSLIRVARSGDGRDLSGWPVQLRVYAVVHSESAAGSPVQPRAYAEAARNAAGPLQVPSSRSVKRWPRLPLRGRSSRGSTRWPTRERQLAGSPVQPRAYAVAAHSSALLPLSSYIWEFAPKRYPKISFHILRYPKISLNSYK
jgi:hypothetical protein